MNTGQTLNDRILAARHSLAGQGLAKAVCKATTEELIGPKKKHLDYLLHCTEEPNVSIPTLANLLLERTQSANWIVVFKSLVSLHHLMCYGNERFIQYLASSNTNFQLSSFLDKSGVQGASVRGYDMSPFVRRYAKYLSEKSLSYRTVAFDFCKVKRGKDGGTLRQMNTEKLLKTLPTLQNQLDALLDFEVTPADLNNGVINCAFMLLFRDLIRLFACYNDGIINLLEKYFDMNKKHARDALDLYKKFLIRMDRVAEFLKVAESVGIDKGDIPDLAKAPSSLLEALEGHLASLEGRKPGSVVTTPTGAAGSHSFQGSAQIDEKLQQKLLQEEEQAMSKFKEHAKATNPFLEAQEATDSSRNDNTPNILDLFGVQAPVQTMSSPVHTAARAAPVASSTSSNKASDDLLQLAGNPFASVMNANTTSSNFGGTNGVHNQNAFGAGFGAPSAGIGFASDSSFTSAFGNDNSSAAGIGASFFGDILQPQSSVGGSNFQPMGQAPGNAGKPSQPAGKLVAGDLDTSLANLTSNLNLGMGQGKNVGMGQTRGPPIGAKLNPVQQQPNMGFNPLMPVQSPMSMYRPSATTNINNNNAFMQDPFAGGLL